MGNAEDKEVVRLGENVVQCRGLLADAYLAPLSPFPNELRTQLREGLSAACPELKEKFNSAQLYLGYANGVRESGQVSDALYIYFQPGHLIVDVDLPRVRERDLKQFGFKVSHRENHQGRNGWLTGWIVPYDFEPPQAILLFMIEALQNH